jgi:hypothetical protein
MNDDQMDERTVVYIFNMVLCGIVLILPMMVMCSGVSAVLK